MEWDQSTCASEASDPDHEACKQRDNLNEESTRVRAEEGRIKSELESTSASIALGHDKATIREPVIGKPVLGSIVTEAKLCACQSTLAEQEKPLSLSGKFSS